ncbi:MAG: SpoIIE family protein phosphatase, partial [Butyrivibrio sp.]|nr:SpoIIE family protein phosphatase [Butyrivibrio sp.]
TEATNSKFELFGTDRMIDALNKNINSDPEGILASVTEDINSFVKEAKQFDDITMLAFKYNGSAKECNDDNKII